MTSFIITSRDKEKRIAFAKDFCAQYKISPFDISVIEKETSVKQNVNSIGIDDVKKMQQTVFLKPLKSELKAVILEDAQLLTNEAQNAMLKILEEPPEQTLLILSADTKESFLPTILSRCKVIELENEGIKLTTRERNDITEFIENLETMSVGEKLKRAESLAKDKDKAILWIEKVLVIMRETMLKAFDTSDTFDTSTLRNLQSLHTLLKNTNVNPRFAIENTFLNL